MKWLANGRYQSSIGILLFVGMIGLAMSQDRLRWNGFVSIGGGMTLDDNEIMTVDGTNGAAYDDRVSFKPDTLFALQAQADLVENLSATAQLVARGGNDFKAQLEWAYVSYMVSDELTFYAGRKRMPIWLYSDTMDVGYSYHWIRPPGDVYRSPLTTYEGVSARYTKPLGVVDSQVEAFFGGCELDPSDTVHVDVDNFGGIFWTLGYLGIQPRIGWSHAKNTSTVTVPFPPFTLVERDNDLNIYSAALSIDLGNLFVIGEAAKLDYERTVNDVEAWYVSTGYHIGKFTPHVTFSEFRESETNAGAGSARVNQTTTVGVRWDFHPSAALKVEFSTVQDKGGTVMDGDSDAIAVAIDIVF